MQTRVITRRAPHAARRKTASLFLRIISFILFVAFLAGGLFSGYLFYDTVRNWVASTPLSTGPELPVIPFISNVVPVPQQEPSTSSGSLIPQQPRIVWERKERINFLLMGVDLRPGERGPTRSDTIIIVTLDPVSKAVGMFSIPRDLWVPIPGYGENRINTAYYLGDAQKYPGGGPALAKKTIQYNFGVPIHYYITINFVGFRKIVDAVGGVTIDVPKDINDQSFPDDNYGYRPLFIPKGRQHMNGEMLLDYARTRHGDSDFGRMKRQQQVLMALKDQALNLNLITKIPALWAAKEDMVQTDLRLDDIISLAQIAKDVKSENIHAAVLDESMALGITTPSGAQVLWPDRERIRTVIEQLFKPPEPVAVQVQPPEQIKRLATESAKIEISNGTSTEGLAGRVAEWLKSQGFNVVLVDNADRRDYAQTVVIESNSRPYALNLLLTIFKVAPDKVRKSPNPKSDVDIRIIIGKDFDDKQIPNSD